MTKYNVIAIKNFTKELKRLAKKYPSVYDDVLNLIDALEIKPAQGTSLGNNFFKIRLSIASKSRGKSGGARVITYIKVLSTSVYLASIYDKSEKSTITRNELNEILNEIE